MIYKYISQCLIVAGLLLTAICVHSQDFKLENGVNLQASYYNNGNVNMGWDLMKSYPEIGAVRIEIEPYRATQAKDWIREAHEHGYQVVATYHNDKKLGTDNKEDLMNAVEWWTFHYNELSSTGPIIINIMNEWGSHSISSEDYADAYNEAINRLRTFYSGQLIIDVPGFGQATKIAADAYSLITDEHFTFSLHIYTSAFNEDQKRWLTLEDLSYLDATGANCMVGEFCNNGSGGADWCTIIDDCYANDWPLFGWAWNGDGRNMNMIEPHWRDKPLSTSYQPTKFMDEIIDKLNGIPCYTSPDEDCNDQLIGDRCDDGNDYTINDRYNDHCHCIGQFTTTLASNTSESDMIIFPNPVRGDNVLSIELFKIFSGGTINIVNSSGKAVLSEKVDRNQRVLVFDITELRNGLHWAKYFTDDEVIVARPFIVL